VSLEVRAGEIVGVAAIEGSGQHELVRVLSGRTAPVRGTLRAPRDVAFIPEDRHRDALVLDMTLAENIALRDLGERRGRMRWQAVREATVETVSRFDVRARGPEARARELSGGNQQKLVFGREIGVRPLAVVAENPTRGLDIRATSAVHDHLRAARDAGSAVVVYSSDLDEVLSLADRMVVVHAGVVRNFHGSRDEIGRAMLGAG
jgi:simple sugar transport system ATP-binding protein